MTPPMKNPPMKARLHWYKLTSAEFALLTAMLEHNSGGSEVRPSVSRLAAYSKLDERTVQRLIRELCGRGILSQLAKGNAGRRRPSIYRINEQAFEEDPKMLKYRRTGQEQLPGIPAAADAVENSPDLVAWCHQSGGIVSPDSKAIYSPPFKNKPYQEQGKALKAVCSVENRPTIGDQMDWKRYLEAKDKLEQKMSQGYGSGLTNAEIHQQQCVMAKLFPSKAKELEELFKRETSA